VGRVGAWSAILHGYAMFRLGAELKEGVTRSFVGCSNTLEVEECEGMREVPRLVGDVKSGMAAVRIGLVRGKVAAKGKLYE
tara:strand:- start:9962 stop:10204 length:243 start_codon:yes stop_codon:yes gene_type:complete